LVLAKNETKLAEVKLKAQLLAAKNAHAEQLQELLGRIGLLNAATAETPGAVTSTPIPPSTQMAGPSTRSRSPGMTGSGRRVKKAAPRAAPYLPRNTRLPPPPHPHQAVIVVPVSPSPTRIGSPSVLELDA
jgi:hypothetical protein